MIKGYGLHSGAYAEVRFHIAEGPVRFWHAKTEIEAHVSNVTSTERCTVLSKDHASLALVEHLLAALHVAGWWQDLLIEVSGSELPILDGSAQGWFEALAELGLAPPAPQALALEQQIGLEEGNSSIRAQPGEASLQVGIAFDHPAIGQQSWSGTSASYRELLDSRTFGFLHELDYLQKRGLASHANLENVIVFDEMAALQALRHADEPVRHKAVDALGDLFLLGKPLTAHIAIMRGSHQLHVAFVKKLQSYFEEIAYETA